MLLILLLVLILLMLLLLLILLMMLLIILIVLLKYLYVGGRETEVQRDLSNLYANVELYLSCQPGPHHNLYLTAKSHLLSPRSAWLAG